MIYLDNSATTYPKPESVTNAVNRAMRRYSFNPGRGGYRRSLYTAEQIYSVRTKIKDFFNAPSEESILFTPGCTQALNMALKGVLKKNDHVIISSFEHNAVVRPLEKLKETLQITCSTADVVVGDDDATLANFRSAINENTRLIVCTHASNAFGIRLPVEKICALAHSYGILFCLDAAQTAGVFDIDILRDGYDLVCCPGHKYLYGPMGIGFLAINKDHLLDTVIEGGTGSRSSDPSMPEFYPDRGEPGTLNVSGIIGLGAGVDFVAERKPEYIYQKEIEMMSRLYGGLSQLAGVELYAPDPKLTRSAPVISFNIKDHDSESIARYLSENADIAVRGGLHCAPLAHRSMGTVERGTVRISPSVFTSEKELNTLLISLRKIR